MKDYQLRQRGFTLIEAIITVAIIAIIVAVAWPLYNQQELKGRRSDAVIALSGASIAMERGRSDNGAYAAVDLVAYLPNVADAPVPACQIRGYQLGAGAQPFLSCLGDYNIAVVVPNPNTPANPDSYTLTATPVPVGRQAGDADCATLTLNNLAQKGFTDTTGNGSVARCWSE